MPSTLASQIFRHCAAEGVSNKVRPCFFNVCVQLSRIPAHERFLTNVARPQPHTPLSTKCYSHTGSRLSSRRYGSVSKRAASSSSPSYEYISLSKANLPQDSGVQATVTICNPAKLNIVNIDTLNELQQVFKSLADDQHVRAIILTGQADASRTASFCAGANIREMESISTPQEAEDFIRRIYDLCETITDLKAITIARIDGLCFGGGLELAACCDFRFGTERSTFSMKEIAVGIPSVVHARLLANIMGWQAAKRMVLLGKVVDADEAHRSSLLDAKFPTADAMDKQIQEDIHLIASYGQKATRAQKELNNVWERTDQDAGIWAGIEFFGKMWEDGGTEPKRHMQAWIQRSRTKK